jgi:hypothetical protein
MAKRFNAPVLKTENCPRQNNVSLGEWRTEHRFPEPIRNYQIAKRQAFEYLLKRTLKLARTA